MPADPRTTAGGLYAAASLFAHGLIAVGRPVPRGAFFPCQFFF